VRRDQDVLDILGLWRGKLSRSVRCAEGSPGCHRSRQRLKAEAHSYLYLGPALDALLERARHESRRWSCIARVSERAAGEVSVGLFGDGPWVVAESLVVPTGAWR
jgi:hypothetical protein